MNRPGTVTAAVSMTLLVAVVGACGGTDAPPSPPVTEPTLQPLVASDFQFEPKQLDIRPGKQISLRLSNSGSAVHNFTVPAFEGIDQDIQPGADPLSFIVGSRAPGTYEFFCKFHKEQGMVGTLVIPG